MIDAVKILITVVGLFLVFRWVLGPNANSGSNGSGNRDNNRSNRRRQVTPDMVEAVKAMFPHIHTAAIQADLALTGSVEATADKILRLGNLPMPAHLVPREATANANNNNTEPRLNQQRTQQQNNEANNNSGAPTQTNLAQKFNVDEKEEINEPERQWSAESTERQDALFKRKQFMIQQARQRMLSKQNSETKSTTSEAS
ncbi:hypothetical protein CONCODRAFT_72019 [Conidiobolus coronatus NRRL 28638]|uniref:CUE domain-containing protein n=1 Tax=Conidiobolus coronatus (strain ATCC 28846 / CBS 209.66 / NRRL 28638) TaxID=796925 RepID=A0A137P135_CONC2|nr:hypothetical protein CONCODRAFT_72019 [Conidiobolus coronatus NRRL 28638]|eukprot:KXN68753.1 hypothetical protein CONCODRAFT_72019 [Conidiobolus coronatus NRRL 28638]